MILKKFVLVQVIFLQLFISGCAYFNAQREDVNSLITKWLAEQEFDMASNTLSEVKTTHPQYLKLMLRKNEIIKKSNLFVATTVKQANFFIKENKWEDAYTVYNFALNRISKNKTLNTAYNNYLQKRQLYVNNLKYKILVHNATRLIKDIPIQRSIALAIKETSVEQNKFANLQKQAIESIDSLVVCSSESLKLKKIEQANNCIQLAIKLGPTDGSLDKLKQQQLTIRELTANQKKRKLRAESYTKSRTLREYQAAFEKNDLVTANKKLTKLLSENKDNYELKKLKTSLDEAINKKIKAGIEIGRILYSKGNIKLALDKWQRLEKLDPDNVKLKSHISRAERVLRKLHTLTNKDEKPKGNGS